MTIHKKSILPPKKLNTWNYRMYTKNIGKHVYRLFDCMGKKLKSLTVNTSAMQIFSILHATITPTHSFSRLGYCRTDCYMNIKQSDGPWVLALRAGGCRPPDLHDGSNIEYLMILINLYELNYFWAHPSLLSASIYTEDHPFTHNVKKFVHIM